MGKLETNAAAVLFAGKATRHAFTPAFDGMSAFARATKASTSFPAVKRLCVLMPYRSSSLIAQIEKEIESLDLSGVELVKIFPEELEGKHSQWSEELLCAALVKASKGMDHAYFLWADTPFVDAGFASSLFERHIEYSPEYTFADCYPLGLAPEIFAAGILPVIADMAREMLAFPARDTLFNVIKKDINAFDIETDIADDDVRMLRLTLACDSARNLAVCEALKGINAQNYAKFIRERQEALRTRPAFYAFQISGRCPFECAFCPYPSVCSSSGGKEGGASATLRSDFMELQHFKGALEKIAEFSDDAVISLSLWGECSFHPEVASFAEEVLKYPKFSLLIETTGIGWQAEALERILAAAEAAQAQDEFFLRPAGAINWIVSLDATSSKMYGELRGLGGAESEHLFTECSNFVFWLKENFKERVYPQFLRMKKNEGELEEFYRFWKEKNGDLIIQKYDHFCSSFPDERVADLSPIERMPCWHLKRDVSVLIDGSVPFCREDAAGNELCGNIFLESLKDIFAKNAKLYKNHISCNYEGICTNCDEYYTFNF